MVVVPPMVVITSGRVLQNTKHENHFRPVAFLVQGMLYQSPLPLVSKVVVFCLFVLTPQTSGNDAASGRA